MRLSVSTYSYGSYINEENLGFKGVLDHAKSIGFEGIEVVDDGWLFKEEVIYKLRDYSEKIGIPLIAFDVGADFTRDNYTKLDDEIERVKKLVDMASEMGIGMMRHDVSYGNFTDGFAPSYDDVLPYMIEGCRRVADYADKLGIVTMFENHGFYIQEKTRIEKLITGVSRDNFGYLVDVGNFMCADENTVESVSYLSKYVRHAHVKDFYYRDKSDVPDGSGWFKTLNGNYLCGSIACEGNACTADCIKILKKSGYNGYLTLEYEGIEDNIVGIERGLENIKKYI